MSTTYAQKQSPAQKKDASSAASVLDSSSQSESLQRKADMANSAAQREEAPRSNNTGMPDNLKSGIESLSGFSMDNVRVHYNSSKPATVQALAYTQGTDIHVAPGQEKHLPHEAWHVAQQMAGRVSPTTNINGMPVNDNAALEHEADVMGEKAVQCRWADKGQNKLSQKIIENKSLQLIRIINGYQQFCSKYYSENENGDEVKRKKVLASATPRLRTAYQNKLENAFYNYWDWNEKKSCWEPTTDDKLIRRALRYCPEITVNAKSKDDGEKDLNKSIDRILSKKIDEDNKLEKNEMLIINAHGGMDDTGTFVFLTPNLDEFTKKVAEILPDGYHGEIYLAGCHSGERKKDNDSFVAGSSFIERFYSKLIEVGNKNEKDLKPSVKGNRNTSRSTDNGVYVKAGGPMNVTGTEKQLSQYEDEKSTKLVDFYKGKQTKSHINSDGIWVE